MITNSLSPYIGLEIDNTASDLNASAYCLVEGSVFIFTLDPWRGETFFPVRGIHIKITWLARTQLWFPTMIHIIFKTILPIVGEQSLYTEFIKSIKQSNSNSKSNKKQP